MCQFINSKWNEEDPIEKYIANIRQQAHCLKELEADITDQWIILVLTNGLPTRNS